MNDLSLEKSVVNQLSAKDVVSKNYGSGEASLQAQEELCTEERAGQ